MNDSGFNPNYETDRDRKNEMEVAAKLATLWRCQLLRNKFGYPADFTVTTEGSAVDALLEVKCRDDYSMPALDRLGGVMVSLWKWSLCRSFCDVGRVPFVFVLRTSDGLWWHRTTSFDHDGLHWKGRTDRPVLNMEPCVLLRAARLRPVVAI